MKSWYNSFLIFNFILLPSFDKILGYRQVENVLAGYATQKSNELMETEFESSHCEVLLTFPQLCPLSSSIFWFVTSPQKAGHSLAITQ